MGARSLVRALVATHLWVGLGAGVQTWLMFRVSSDGALTPDESTYVGVAGLGAAGFYTLYRALGRRRVGARPSRDWALEYGAAFAGVAALESRGLPSAYFALSAAPLVVVAVYTLGRYRSGNAAWFGIAKPFLLAAVWTWVVAYVPMARSGTIDVALLTSRGCFFLAIGLASDYKDNAGDLRNGLRTLSGAISARSGLWICVGLMVASCLLASSPSGSVPAASSLSLASAVGAAVHWYAFRQNPGRWYYDLIVDGLLVLAGVFYVMTRLTGA